ncbi:MAG TPA: sucrase ferredoxin [Marmoricola sp.]|nr:sucrase ferredoxin [Marmoricola sp.]
MTPPGSGFRCSLASLERSEPQEGTASTVRAFLVVECPGPWGVDAVRDSRLPDTVKQLLQGLEEHNRVRPLLARRPGRSVAGPVSVFAAHVHTQHPWLESVELDSVEKLLDHDLSGLGAGRSLGWERRTGPLFLACTHGRHDACCAERGRPLCAALARAAPGQTWEVSHIGGDRFAANVLVLPQGLYYGRLEPEDAPAFAGAHREGRLDLDHLRGRSSYPFSVQAAEVHLRRHLGVDRAAPFPLVDHARSGTETTVVFDVDGERWEVRVHADLGGKRQLTCRAAAPSIGAAHELVRITRTG